MHLLGGLAELMHIKPQNSAEHRDVRTGTCYYYVYHFRNSAPHFTEKQCDSVEGVWGQQSGDLQPSVHPAQMFRAFSMFPDLLDPMPSIRKLAHGGWDYVWISLDCCEGNI